MSDFVDLTGIDPEAAAARLTMAGLEVAAISQLCPPALDLVISAQITAMQPHPEADKLSLCTVNDGKELLTIVCGAHNMQAGDKVALAPVGTRLPNGLNIKKSKIRGIVSTGMLCSSSELGLEESSVGIMILPAEVPLGEPVVKLLHLQDTVLELEITPNRGDCLSVIGVARELAAIYKRPFILPEISLVCSDRAAADLASIKIVDPELCPRYVGRVVEEIVLEDSPLWLKVRLRAAGVRSISNVVDVTNYVMLETGQPLHAFDLDLLNRRQIEVRRAGAQEKFVTLDANERQLDSDTLMICDGQGPVAIAGIMGGLNSEINAQTRNVLIESAFFQPASIRRSARLLNLGTEASYRFERGVDSQATARAADRAAQLLQTLAQGQVAQGSLDIHPQPRLLPEILLRPSRANKLLGLELDPLAVKDILERLQIKIVRETADAFYVIPPAYRFDIEREVDLIEEIARIYGYDKVPVTAACISDPEVIKRPETGALERLREVVKAYGYNEAVNYSFIDPQVVGAMQFTPTSRFYDFVRLRNPISSEMAVMRTSLLPGLLTNLKDNLRVNVKDVRLFEVGRNFYKLSGEKLPAEELHLAVVATGRRYREHFAAPDQGVDFFDLKGLLEEIAADFRMDLTFLAENYYNCLTPGRAATIKAGSQAVGSIGQLQRGVAQSFDLDCEVFLFEIALQPWFAASAANRVAYQGLARYPAVYRDLAFLVDETIGAADMLDYLRQQHELLVGAEVFDVFQSETLPQGKKSLAFRLTFQDMNKTLTDKKVNAIITKLIKGIEDTFAGAVR
ncbi:MAG: phenylalanine--tRNA ligase subunit beta [Deltaproteobacteria bacterium]|nr:phenylalanine--tRNA ligase subunit beta [Deltaproteobacteria bacterium]